MKGTIEMQISYYYGIIFRDKVSIIFRDICYLLVFKAFSYRGNTQCYCAVLVKKKKKKSQFKRNNSVE